MVRSGLSYLGRRNTTITIGLVLAASVAIAMRLYGLTWDAGLMWTPHPDERAILMKVSGLSMPSLGQFGSLLEANSSPLNPRWFPYGSLPLYLLKVVQGLFSMVGMETVELRHVGRGISALADVGTVLLVYVLGKRIYGSREGLLAAALLAMAVLHIQASHFFTVDTLLGFFTVASLLFLFRVAQEGRAKDSIIAGVFIGLGLATKASIVPIFIPVIFAHLIYAVHERAVSPEDNWSPWTDASKGVVVVVAASLLVLVVVQPYTIIDWTGFIRDLTEQSEMVQRIRDYPYTRQYIGTTPYWYQVSQSIVWGLGLPLGLVVWVGAFYACVRGMKAIYGLVYIASGIAVPMAILVLFNSYVAMVISLLLASISLALTLKLRTSTTRGAAILLSWVVPYFLLTGSFEVKFLRYLIPITPVLVLFGAHLLVEIWERACKFGQLAKVVAGTMCVLCVMGTAMYAASYMAVYSSPHTSVRMSQWINNEADKGAVILKEHWEEGLPRLENYLVTELPIYDPDTPQKLKSMSENLARAEFVVFFSNRLYGTIPRLKYRYPSTTAYYNLLFTQKIGYELANVETAFQEVAGVSVLDDTFQRPGLLPPKGMGVFMPPGPKIRMGFADESFSVYDHPMGMIFKNTGHYKASEIENIIRKESEINKLGLEKEKPTENFMIPRERWEIQQKEGTWTEITRANGWPNKLPLLAWFLAIQGMAFIVLPVTMIIFWPLPDRGYLFSKATSILTVTLVVWIATSMQWASFSATTVLAAVCSVSVVSSAVMVVNRKKLIGFFRRNWRILVLEEAVFIFAFLFFVAIRMANPDLWHPYLGGEKPMDLAYLTAVLKSSQMPPYDPWFSGASMNYYYLGYLMVATVTKMLGLLPTVAFNLAIATFYAMTAAGAFCITYNLVGYRRGTVMPGKGINWRGVYTGLTGLVLVAVVGNLDGGIQVVQGIIRVAIHRLPFGDFDFWRSTRMMPPDPPGFEITEFPFFTFLFGDLHAHAMAIPFTLVVIGLSLAIVLSPPARFNRSKLLRHLGIKDIWDVARLVVLGVFIGALWLINAWDYPTYALVGVAAIVLAAFLNKGKISRAFVTEASVKSITVILVSYLLYLPFHTNYQAPHEGIAFLQTTTNKTPLWQFFAINGLFIFILGTFFFKRCFVSFKTGWQWLTRWETAALPKGNKDERKTITNRAIAILFMVAIAAGTGFMFGASALGTTAPALVLLGASVFVVMFQEVSSPTKERRQVVFVSLLAGIAIVIVIGLEFFRVRDDIDRMNSVFKFYLQIWILFSIVSAYLLWRTLGGLRRSAMGMSRWGRGWMLVLVILILGATAYPVLATPVRLKNRFNTLPPTLDGMAYMDKAVYGDPTGQIDISLDRDAIVWMNQNIKGSPVILEGSTPIYRWGGRVSIYTGLPTVIGWSWHQEQQRWRHRQLVKDRQRDVNRIYSTINSSEAISLLRKYGVGYLYIGELERQYYPSKGIAKFENDKLGGAISEIYRNEQVRIYRVK